MSDNRTEWSHDVKIEQTAKGARVTVHAFSNSQSVAIAQAVNMYMATIDELKKNNMDVAPIEQGRGKTE